MRTYRNFAFLLFLAVCALAHQQRVLAASGCNTYGPSTCTYSDSCMDPLHGWCDTHAYQACQFYCQHWYFWAPAVVLDVSCGGSQEEGCEAECSCVEPV